MEIYECIRLCIWLPPLATTLSHTPLLNEQANINYDNYKYDQWNKANKGTNEKLNDFNQQRKHGPPTYVKGDDWPTRVTVGQRAKQYGTIEGTGAGRTWLPTVGPLGSPIRTDVWSIRADIIAIRSRTFAYNLEAWSNRAQWQRASCNCTISELIYANKAPNSGRNVQTLKHQWL